MRRSLLCAAILAATLPLACENAIQTFDGNQLPTGLVSTSSLDTLTATYSQGSPAQLENVIDGAPLLRTSEAELSLAFDAGTDRIRFAITDLAGDAGTVLELTIPADRVTATLASGGSAPYSPTLKGIVALDAEILGAVPTTILASVPGCLITNTRTVFLHIEKERIEFTLVGADSLRDTAAVGPVPVPGQTSCGALLVGQVAALQDPAVNASVPSLETALEREVLDLSRIRFLEETAQELSLVGVPGSGAASGAASASPAAVLPVILLDDGEGGQLRAAAPLAGF